MQLPHMTHNIRHLQITHRTDTMLDAITNQLLDIINIRVKRVVRQSALNPQISGKLTYRLVEVIGHGPSHYSIAPRSYATGYGKSDTGYSYPDTGQMPPTNGAV